MQHEACGQVVANTLNTVCSALQQNMLPSNGGAGERRWCWGKRVGSAMRQPYHATYLSTACTWTAPSPKLCCYWQVGISQAVCCHDPARHLLFAAQGKQQIFYRLRMCACEIGTCAILYNETSPHIGSHCIPCCVLLPKILRADYRVRIAGDLQCTAACLFGWDLLNTLQPQG